jgi:hypothetical protein
MAGANHHGEYHNGASGEIGTKDPAPLTETISVQDRFISAHRIRVHARAEPQQVPKLTGPPLAPEPNDKDAAFMLLEVGAVWPYVPGGGVA